jgi:hypothetical protein
MGDGGKDYILSAAAICFADAWRLSDKLGKNLVGVHAPVAITQVSPRRRLHSSVG